MACHMYFLETWHGLMPPNYSMNSILYNLAYIKQINEWNWMQPGR